MAFGTRSSVSQRGSRIAWVLLALSFTATSCIALILVFTIRTGQDLVKLRNSLLVEVQGGNPYAWRPSDKPPGFIWETEPASEYVRSIAAEIDGEHRNAHEPSNLDRVILIARELASAKPSGKAIKSTTDLALSAIRESSGGYCADYTQVLNGLALSLGIPIREWGMSFDGYSGDGHAFSEVYDYGLDKWTFLDSYFSFYVTNAAGIPLSVEEFHGSLAGSDPEDLVVVPIDAQKFGFSSPAAAVQYYERGAASFFMVWGNNVFSYDSSPILEKARFFGRAAEQAAAIAFRYQPRMVVKRQWMNEQGIIELRALRFLVYSLLLSIILLTLSAFYLVLAARRIKSGSA